VPAQFGDRTSRARFSFLLSGPVVATALQQQRARRRTEDLRVALQHYRAFWISLDDLPAQT
jgi:hypothetical protein